MIYIIMKKSYSEGSAPFESYTDEEKCKTRVDELVESQFEGQRRPKTWFPDYWYVTVPLIS